MTLLSNSVDIWSIDTAKFPHDLTSYFQLLSQEEQLRSQRFKFEKDKRLNILARSGLRLLAGQYLNCTPVSIQMGYAAYDKPYFLDYPEFKFNISHSGEMVVLAFVIKLELGVDVEYIKTDFEVMEIADNFFASDEIENLKKIEKELQFEAFYRCWTRKEAFIKAKGSGLSFPLADFSVTIGEKAELLATRWDENEKNEWSLSSFMPKKDYVGALAVHVPVKTINYHEWKGLEA
ncbi:4'-phosphopantetheinyl transferase family protein [Euzebyella saccharophila]|uniref:4'-phosphopantetheinyl transferase family protein n=1 Tax=Euzebyella saccharophila TaxID=679664 RepID=A0ABV8JV55_9FLAO|nr:4'-phosphopantetheinyl transferase superfamily protein [Euzebyella saccharophila]